MSQPDETGAGRRFPVFWFLIISAALTLLVTQTVARIEDKYFETHRVFLDPGVYQEHLFKLWQASHEKNVFELAWTELSDPAEGGDIPPLAFRTIPLLLLYPDSLKSPHAHLITSGFSLFVFLFLLLLTIYRRTHSSLYATAAAVLVCVTPVFYHPVSGLGAFWLDLTAGFLSAAAVLCLLNSERSQKLGWLTAFAVFAAISLLSRFVTGFYLFVQAGPVLAFYLIIRWRQTKSFLSGVLLPVSLIAAILLALVGWYIWRQAPSQSFYYSQESYDCLSLLTSAQFVFGTLFDFIGYGLLPLYSIILVCQIVSGYRVAWRGLIESIWLVLGALLVLVVACQIARAPYAIEYIVPILLFALLSPIDWSHGSGALARWPVRFTVKILAPLTLLVAAAISLNHTLHDSLWNPPAPTPQEADRKAVNDQLVDEIMHYFPEKVVGAYFDQFDEYAFVTAFERYGRPPRLLANRTFDIRAEYLRARFPNRSAQELADAARQEAAAKCDIVLVFNDPAAASKPAPFDFGWSLNPYSEAISSQLAQQVQSDPNWEKLFVAKSKYVAGGVAAYANLNRFPDASPIAAQ
ncbi:MAG: hypothetical protein C5B58_02405 [Acidobacteria bacterium]|nr:MAG: hypothetical protein C5B58_02405 [Acidobacteriota bacterium]